MTRQHQVKVAIGVLFATLFVVPWAFGPSQGVPSLPQGRVAEATIAAATNSPAGLSAEFWNAKITDWLIALFTLCLAWFTWELKHSTDKMWEVTKESIESSEEGLSARLYPTFVSYSLPVHEFRSYGSRQGATRRASVDYKLTNFGDSPAFLVDVLDQLVVSREVPSRKKWFRNPDVQGRVVSPGHATTDLRATLDRVLVEAEIEQYGADWHFYLLVWVKYQDIFGYTIIEDFCMRLHPGTDNFVRSGGLELNERFRFREDDEDENE